MAIAANLGYPRIGARRELKRALEAHWAGHASAEELQATARSLRAARWLRQKHLGIALVPSNDFSLYDQVLDTAWMLGAVPGSAGEGDDLAAYFRLARGGNGNPALEMTKWFDTNYHYLVPELAANHRFTARPAKPLTEFAEALALGVSTRPVLIGPVTFLKLSKRVDGGDPLELLPRLLPVYAETLQALEAAGVRAAQIDEPWLVMDQDDASRAAFRSAYTVLRLAAPRVSLMLATYFGSCAEEVELLRTLPIDGLHLDLVRAPGQLDAFLEHWPKGRAISLGLVDGRNVWRCDLAKAARVIAHVSASLGEDAVQVAPSCSLLHVPLDLDEECSLDPAARSRLSFAAQKLAEVASLARGDGALSAPPPAAPVDGEVRRRARAVGEADLKRQSPYAQRAERQSQRLALPPIPTTTIGSFPQTDAVRKLRADHRAGRVDDASYEQGLREVTADAIARQERLGLDVLVHGEFERTDMVEHFAELLDGFAITENGWVQSYGSRCVKPPLIVGDVARRAPMTVSWTRYAQSLTAKPVKGMLTGPVTILQWSFVREDQPRSETCRQIALAIRDEVTDLEAGGAAIVQIDEPALREGLPLRRGGRAAYLSWAVDCFRLASCGARDETQIHTHMCYSEFSDIMESIIALDADVLSIETARSRMELLSAFRERGYPLGVGPGIYDIHSPRLPTRDEMAELLSSALAVIPAERLWANPDCGLKTRSWAQVEPALERLVAATADVRATLATYQK